MAIDPRDVPTERLYRVTLACGCAYPFRQRQEWKPEPGDRMYCHRCRYEYHIAQVEEIVEPPAPAGAELAGGIWSQ